MPNNEELQTELNNIAEQNGIQPEEVTVDIEEVIESDDVEVMQEVNEDEESDVEEFEEV